MKDTAGAEVGTVCVVPFVSRGRVLGTFGVVKYQNNAFAGDIEFLTQIGKGSVKRAFRSGQHLPKSRWGLARTMSTASQEPTVWARADCPTGPRQAYGQCSFVHGEESPTARPAKTAAGLGGEDRSVTASDSAVAIARRIAASVALSSKRTLAPSD